MSFVGVDGKPISNDEEEAYFVYKPYSKNRIPGIYPEGHLGIGHRETTPKFRWSTSTLKRIADWKKSACDQKA